ncbi:MAG: hypothetical protein WB557_11305, partial [Solirubrobacteraceae bacterium]
AHASVGAALTVASKAAQSGHPALAVAIHNGAHSAFFAGFSAANYLAAGVAGAGAVMALMLLPAHPNTRAEEAPRLQATASPTTSAARS